MEMSTTEVIEPNHQNTRSDHAKTVDDSYPHYATLDDIEIMKCKKNIGLLTDSLA